MSVTGQLTQVSQLLVQQAKHVPSIMELFFELTSSVNKSPETPRIKSLEGLSTERISILYETFPNPEYAVGTWTLQDFSNIESWKTQYPEDYEKIKSSIGEIIELTRISRNLWLNRAWDILNYIFTGYSSDTDLPFSIREDEDIPQINLFWGGNTIMASDGLGDSYLEDTEVQELAAALSRMSQRDIYQQFEQGFTTQPNIYSFTWREQDYQWLFDLCSSVKKFYIDAANRGNAILININ